MIEKSNSIDLMVTYLQSEFQKLSCTTFNKGGTIWHFFYENSQLLTARVFKVSTIVM